METEYRTELTKECEVYAYADEGFKALVNFGGWRVAVPAEHVVSHEEQFREAAKTVLGWVRDGQPQSEYDHLLLKYRTLVDAFEKSAPHAG